MISAKRRSRKRRRLASTLSPLTMELGGFLALDKVELKVRPARPHALAGEKGAARARW